METQDFYANINYLAVLVAAIVYFALGALWYSPVLFGKMWMEARNITAENANRDGMAKIFIITFILNLVCVFLAATFVSALGANGISDGINLGLRFALGFAVTTMGINYMYDNKSSKLFWIDAGYHIVGIVAATIILSVWK
ncbi:MAG: DUF1761 domain-containing protein [Bacteroidia bacterium]